MSTAFESFITVHQYQLASIPEELWQPLFMKLGEDYLDAGNFVELHHGDPLENYSLHVKSDTVLKKHSDIFLIDHAWTTSPETAKEELINNVPLMDRLENLMDIEQLDAPEDSDDDEDEEVEKPSEELIQLVAAQANVSNKVAEAALIAENNEVINAIMTLTIDPEAKAEADRLHDQVMTQVLQSGKPQEKEEQENKGRLERRQQREKEWFKQRAEIIYEKMWSYIQTYTYSILQQDGQPVSQTAWYVNDEVGSAICHSSTPNVACAPFIFSRGPRMIPYSVFYPIKDIEAGEIITCDLVPKNFERDSDKTAYLFAFQDRVLMSSDIEEKRKQLISLAKSEQEKLSNQKPRSFSTTCKPFSVHKTDSTGSVTVYTDVSFVQQFLKLEGVKFTNDPKNADIIWSSQDFQDWDSLSESQTINQIPNESCLTFKHNLAKLVQNAYGAPEWLPPTYNIMTELSEFVGDYLNNEDNNLWITKPWNMARGIGLDITRNLSEIIRQHDSPVPKIAQRYVLSPCLYNGKKFDLRYIVLVRKTSPDLVACIYNMFWTRLANKKFDLEDLADYERQFTVMNYTNYQMTQLDHKSFIHNMEKQYDIKWEPIQKDINNVIRDVLVAAANTPSPLGFAGNDTFGKFDSFSVYGFDIMLTSDFKPVLLEVNFSPDCTRACQYDPEFVNNIFSVVDQRFDSLEKGLKAFTVL